MGKWTKYKKKFCAKWEKDTELKDWICRVPGDDSKAFCKYCKCELRAHYGDLTSHASSEKHRRNSAPFSNARRLNDMGINPIQVNNSVKSAEQKLAAHIACHSSITTVNHLGELVKEISGKDIGLHRTKCTALITSVLGPAAHEELIAELKDSPYSLIIDESTVISTEKQLCVLVRFYSESLKKIVTSFLGIILLSSGTAEGIFNALSSFLAKNNMSLDKCLGIATDGCNAMCGRNNSVIVKCREVCPDIVHIKCVCHSLQLCSSHAAKMLPRNIEFMIAETYNYFSHSTVRQNKYKSLYSCINVGEEPLKLLKLSDTRWLSLALCIQRVLSQYEELKLHFQMAKDEERNYTAELLFQMYSSPENRLYLIFLNPIVSEINRVNKPFQLERANPLKLLNELITLYISLLKRIMRPRSFETWKSALDYDIYNKLNHLPLGAVYFGVNFHIALSESGIEDTQAAGHIKERCHAYLFELLKEMRGRLSHDVVRLESLAQLTPSIVLSEQQQQLSRFSFISLYKGELGTLEQQWERLNCMSWGNIPDNDIEQFWINVYNHHDASDKQDFQDIGKFALSLLSLPFSNAAVERTFSQMNIIKSKLRNRMKQNLLENMRIRDYMARNDICCNSFKPTEKMLMLFTQDIYNVKDVCENEDD